MAALPFDRLRACGTRQGLKGPRHGNGLCRSRALRRAINILQAARPRRAVCSTRFGCAGCATRS